MALSEAQRRANDKYIAENYKQVKLSMPKEEAQILDDFCKKYNYTKAGFIREAIKEKMNRIENNFQDEENEEEVREATPEDIERLIDEAIEEMCN